MRVKLLLISNVFPHGHQGVQTLLKSHNLESHVTGGQDKNTNSVKDTQIHTHTQRKMNIQIPTLLAEQPDTAK